MDEVEEMLVIYQPNENTNYPNDFCKATELNDFFGAGFVLHPVLRCAVHIILDLSNLRPHACSDDWTLASAIRDGCE